MTNVGSRLQLTSALGSYAHFDAIRRGDVTLPDVDLHFEDVPVTEAFKHMCRDLAYDVSEMSITGYLLARRYHKGMTALPVFPVRAFGQSHASIAAPASAGLQDPRDIEGKAVGARAYTGTASIWARGVLASEYGVDVDRVTWVSTDDEHVLEYQQDAPANAVYELGSDLGSLLASGRLTATIGLSAPGMKALIPGARYPAREWFVRTGVYQINHVIVIKDTLLAEHGWLGEALYDAFVQAKQAWLDRAEPSSIAAELDLPGRDPLPYGISANRPTINALLDFASDQKILERRYTVEEVFPLSFD